jgi:D-alanyl-lipoteichoic acid acyltransferase DltB (MBOAT superfamily)
VLYNSLQFLFVFLPVCLLLYFLIARFSGRMANAVLAGMSFIFYAWWNPRDLVIIAASILMNYALGLILRGRPTGARHARVVLTIGIAANLLALAYFKYANFLLYNVDALSGRHFSPLHIVLPLGISFFTFTQIAFLVDAYQGKARELGFFRYCLFVAFFPHLIAGPIVHHSELMPQFGTKGAKRWTPTNVDIGIAFLSLGLLKKVILADSCAPWADQVFNAARSVSFFDAWRGAIAYTLQLYFDFSGYSDMAIGLAMMFNIRLPDNFDSPYKAVSIVDFWRRWHMTLSRFLRDYLYIPLGGNRKGEARRRLNLLITMLLGGIWHGAGWTFAIWGAYHGLLLTLNHLWFNRHRSLPLPMARLLTFLAVIVGWVFFRSRDLPTAADRLRSMAAIGPAHLPTLFSMSQLRLQAILLTVLLLVVNFAPNTKQWVEARPLTIRRAILLGVIFFFCVLWIHDAYVSKEPQPFIYFQF